MDQPRESADVLARAMAVAEHPAARCAVAGEAPARGRSLFGRMNKKLKALTLAAAAVPLYVAVHAWTASPLPARAPEPASSAGQSAPAAPATKAAAKASAAHVAQTAPASQSVQSVQAGAPPREAASQASPSAAASSARVAASGALGLGTSAVAGRSSAHEHGRESAPERSAIERAIPGGGEGMDAYGIARALAPVDSFAALAAAVEDVKAKPYYDSGGLNVGFGYCVTKRKAEYGAARVKADLLSAGFTPAQAQALASERKAEAAKIAVTPMQAVKLLEATKADYEGIARAAVGAELFDSLPEHRRGALTYLAYNTGNVGQFTKLISALRRGDDAKAMEHIEIHWRDSGGNWRSNDRSEAYLRAALLGPDHLARALDNPSAFESLMANPQGRSHFVAIAEASQKLSMTRLKLLERRLRSNPWASQAAALEEGKLPAAPGQVAGRRAEPG